jgi:tetraacyldisaccharide 4'-kinase
MKPTQFRKRAEDIIDGKDDYSVLSKVLLAVSKIYALTMNCRAGLYKHEIFRKKRLPCRVIAFGNLTMGGTGKTPMAIYTAKLLREKGLKVAVISRGYMGKFESSGRVGIVSDGTQLLMGPDEAGDEPFLMATKLEKIPVLVGKNRYAAGMLAWKTFSPEVIILDDAFQHLGLHRDLNILLLDAAKPFGNYSVFPRGNLREPVRHAKRADAIILTRYFRQNDTGFIFSKKTNIIFQKKPVFKTFHQSIGFTTLNKSRQWCKYPLGAVISKRCVAFCGIAQHQDFQNLIREIGCQVTHFLTFPDHHQYSQPDIKQILETAAISEADILLTTEKDLVKLSETSFIPYKLFAICIDIFFWNNRKAYENLILSV